MFRILQLLFVCAFAGSFARGEAPAFAHAPLHAAGEGRVVDVAETEAADLIVLAGGIDAGFREGMLAQVVRGDIYVATVLLAAVAGERAVALITDLAPEQVIASGDRVRIQTFQLNS